jgi:hypothetical protein
MYKIKGYLDLPWDQMLIFPFFSKCIANFKLGRSELYILKFSVLFYCSLFECPKFLKSRFLIRKSELCTIIIMYWTTYYTYLTHFAKGETKEQRTMHKYLEG